MLLPLEPHARSILVRSRVDETLRRSARLGPTWLAQLRLAPFRPLSAGLCEEHRRVALESCRHLRERTPGALHDSAAVLTVCPVLDCRVSLLCARVLLTVMVDLAR